MSETTKRIETDLWNIFIERHGCKPNKEDCEFKSCNHWAECSLLVEQLATHLHQEVIRGKVATGNAFLNYTTHDDDCICSQWRQGRPTKDGGYERLFGYGNNERWYKEDENPKCSCGLDKIIDRLADLTAELEGEE